MSKQCALTGVKFMSGNQRSHSLHATRKIWKANLHKVKLIDANGQTISVYVSARALRTLAKQNGNIKRA